MQAAHDYTDPGPTCTPALPRRSPAPRPWENEPDVCEWDDDGYQCVARRGGGGAWCGYVVLPKHHPLHGLDVCDGMGVSVENSIDAHGGVTWCGELEHENVTARGWAIGFDCGHFGDLIPAQPAGGTYRDLAYVKREVQKVLAQVRIDTKAGSVACRLAGMAAARAVDEAGK